MLNREKIRKSAHGIHVTWYVVLQSSNRSLVTRLFIRILFKLAKNRRSTLLCKIRDAVDLRRQLWCHCNVMFLLWNFQEDVFIGTLTPPVFWHLTKSNWIYHISKSKIKYNFFYRHNLTNRIPWRSASNETKQFWVVGNQRVYKIVDNEMAMMMIAVMVPQWMSITRGLLTSFYYGPIGFIHMYRRTCIRACTGTHTHTHHK